MSPIGSANDAAIAMTNSVPDTYPIVVSGATALNYAITHSNGTLTVFAEGLAITNQPTNVSTLIGGAGEFSIGVSGTAPFSFQWWFNQTNVLSGATNATLALTNVQPVVAGNYHVVVTNIIGSGTSVVATLTVNTVGTAPAITLQPTNQFVLAGRNITLTIQASGTSPLHAQWWKNSQAVVNATNFNLTLTNVHRIHQGYYQAQVTNATGQAVSSNAFVRVVVPPRLQRLLHLPDGRFRFYFTDHDGNLLTTDLVTNFVIQASGDLQGWTNVSFNGSGLVFTNGEFLFEDVTATNALRRYFRVLEK